MAIEWDRLERRQFDEIVHALLCRMYADADSVEVVDGRGGDGGRDVVVVQGGRQRIFQLKYFPDGFPSRYRGRRQQIRRSFEAAIRHRPYAWILVVPCELTDSERHFVNALGDGHDTEVSIMDRPRLNGHVAAFPDLDAYFTRNQLVELAKIFNQEKAALLGGAADLEARTRALGRVVDGMDPHWTLDFVRSGGTIIYKLRPKHPRAQQVSPIKFEVQATLGPNHSALADAIVRVIGFGAAEKIHLPADVVDRWQITGPS